MLGRRGKTVRLDQVRNPNCRSCSLWRSSANVCIMGRGNVQARIVLIGEAPGESEADTGKPFMGKSGQWMNDRLRELRMTEMVYITNPVKCRPPKNRKPEPGEIQLCVDQYLTKELKIVADNRHIVVVPMGNTAAESLGLDLKSIDRNKPFFLNHEIFNGYVCMTWHPAYCIRMGKGTTQRQFTETLRWAKRMAINLQNGEKP